MSETVAARRPIPWARDRVALAALLAGLLLLPWAVAGRVSLSIFLFIGLNALIAVGLTLLGGYAGQVSLGQAAFYGVGAYVSAITTLRYGVDPWLGMICAVAGAALLAWVVGAPILILRGHYLVLGTLALNVVVDVLFRNLQHLTGGPSGLTGIPPLGLGPVTLAGDRALYYLSWAAVLGALGLSRNLVRSRVGRALAAVRGSEVVAATLAINPASYKGRVFALSAAFAGLAGRLLAAGLAGHLLTAGLPLSRLSLARLAALPGSRHFAARLRLLASLCYRPAQGDVVGNVLTTGCQAGGRLGHRLLGALLGALGLLRRCLRVGPLLRLLLGAPQGRCSAGIDRHVLGGHLACLPAHLGQPRSRLLLELPGGLLELFGGLIQRLRGRLLLSGSLLRLALAHRCFCFLRGAFRIIQCTGSLWGVLAGQLCRLAGCFGHTLLGRGIGLGFWLSLLGCLSGLLRAAEQLLRPFQRLADVLPQLTRLGPTAAVQRLGRPLRSIFGLGQRFAKLALRWLGALFLLAAGLLVAWHVFA